MEQFSQQSPSKYTTAATALHHNNDPLHKDNFFVEIVKFSIIALLIVLPIRIFIAQPFIVSGASMEDTFESGQYLIVDQVTYRLEEPKRGDVIVFKYPRDPSKYFIKRIIALPGDTINIEGRNVTVTNDDLAKGVLLDEPYVDEMSPGSPLSETLSEREYFVMGDNRDASSDSRSWGILPRENIVGRAYIRLFPFTDIGLLPGNYDTDAHLMSTTP